MRTVPIPDTNLKPAALCLGTAVFGSEIDRAASFALLDDYFERGGNFLDSAKMYADWLPGERSASEKTIGRWMRERKNRDRVILATKGGSLDPATKIARLARADIESDIAGSLENLQTDVIDLYWLHRDDVNRPVGEIMETLAAQARAGKIRHIGCSNWTLERIRLAQAYARRHRLPGFVGNQMKWSLAVPDPQAPGDPTMVAMDDDLKRYHTQTQLAAIPFSSQAGGWFQKRAKARGPIPGAFATDGNERRFRAVQKLSAETGLTITQIVLGCLLSHPFPVIPIIGSHTREQLEDTLAAADVRLGADQMAGLQ